MEAQRIRRRYDHRFREVFRETGDVELAVRNGVPRSTARDWSRLASPKVITLDVASMSDDELRREVIGLREHNARLLAILRLVVVLLKVCEVSLRQRRVPDGDKKVCFRWGCKIFGERPESSPDEAEAADPSRVIATRSFRSRGRAGRYLRGGYADEDRGRESRL